MSGPTKEGPGGSEIEGESRATTPGGERGGRVTAPQRELAQQPTGPTGMRDVAKVAGVAMSSVSRVLSGHPDVSAAMRERVLAAVEALDYKPDMLAQGLRRRETMTVGFVVGDLSNSLIAQFVKGAETALGDTGYSMLLTNSLFDPDLDRSHIELLGRRRVDGLLVLTVSESHPPTIAALEQIDIPIVALERTLPSQLRASCVFSDHAGGMRPAVDELLDLGHRRIALITGQRVRPTRERIAALRACFERRGLPETFEVFEGRYLPEHGARVTRELLARDQPPTAVIAASNQIMRGALQTINEQGVELGRELSFIGCDDAPLARLFNPQLATLERDAVALGRSAAALLVARLRDEDEPPTTVVQPTYFVPGPSCGPPPS